MDRMGNPGVMDVVEDLPIAVVTIEGGACAVPVVEVGGVLRDRRDGVELDLHSIVVVLGLPALVA